MSMKTGIVLGVWTTVFAIGSLFAQAPMQGRQTSEPPLAGEMSPVPRNLPPQNLPPLEPASPAPIEDPEFRPARGVSSPMPPLESIRPEGVPMQSGIVPTGLIAPEPPTPYVVLTVRGPANAASASDITYRIFVRNPSQATARNVLVKALIPKNAKYLRSKPVANASSETQWEWQIGNLEAGGMREISVVAQPNDTSAVDVIARVSFEFGQWVQTKISQPTLKIAPTGAKIGIVQDSLSYRVELNNTGKVPITGVTVEIALTKDLQKFDPDNSGASTSKPETATRMWQIGNIGPGQTRVIDYKATAIGAGEAKSKMVILGNGVRESADFVTKISEPKLTMSVGAPDPKTALVGQPANYRITVENKGDAPMSNIRVQMSHPTDMRVRKAVNGGQYFTDSTAQWMIPRLEAGQSKQINVGLQAQTMGLKKVIVTARGDRGPEALQEVTNDFQGMASLTWGDFQGPSQISAGDKFDYLVKVNNPGTGAAKDFRLEVILPAGIRFESSDTGGQLKDGRVVFHPKHGQIDPQTAMGFSFKASSTAESSGTKRIRFHMIAKQLESEVVHDRSITILGSASSGIGQTGGSFPTPVAPPAKTGGDPASTAAIPAVPMVPAIPTGNEKKPPMPEPMLNFNKPPESPKIDLPPPPPPAPMELPKIELPPIVLPKT